MSTVQSMKALVYEAPYQMTMREVPMPQIGADEVLIRVAFSGICGSELSGFEGKNSLRFPPLIMGHEFSGTIEAIGAQVRDDGLKQGMAVTANPLLSCQRCAYCLRGQQQLCPKRKLSGAGFPGSNAEFMAIRADAVFRLPEGLSMPNAALVEPAACAVHAVRLLAPNPDEQALVVGAGPIGLLVIAALRDAGVKTIFCVELNEKRLKMAEQLGAKSTTFGALKSNQVDLAVDAVGANVTRQGCVASVRSGGRIVWTGLHEADSTLPINDVIRREITSYGSFAYTPLDFGNALQALIQGRLTLAAEWTRIEPLSNGTPCFEELLHGSPIAKIWLTPQIL